MITDKRQNDTNLPIQTRNKTRKTKRKEIETVGNGKHFSWQPLVEIIWVLCLFDTRCMAANVMGLPLGWLIWYNDDVIIQFFFHFYQQRQQYVKYRSAVVFESIETTRDLSIYRLLLFILLGCLSTFYYHIHPHRHHRNYYYHSRCFHPNRTVFAMHAIIYFHGKHLEIFSVKGNFSLKAPLTFHA